MVGRLDFTPRRCGHNARSIPDTPLKRKKIGHSCLRKPIISQRKSEEILYQSETQWVCPIQDQCRIVSQSWLNRFLVGEQS